jgi:ankyrin repeat protein
LTDDSLKQSFPSPSPAPQELEAFVTAVGKGDFAAVSAFLKKYPAAIDEKNANGDTALIAAAQLRQGWMVKLLLENGAAVDIRNKNSWTPLIWASVWGGTDVAVLLLDRGAQIDARSLRGQTPLMLASWTGRTDTVRMLLERGADIDAIDIQGRTPLMIAREQEKAEAAALLEQWLEQRRLHDAQIAEAKVQAQAAAQLEKLKNHRPPAPPFKKNNP